MIEEKMLHEFQLTVFIFYSKATLQGSFPVSEDLN